jgi:hypothetical protein
MVEMMGWYKPGIPLPPQLGQFALSIRVSLRVPAAGWYKQKLRYMGLATISTRPGLFPSTPTQPTLGEWLLWEHTSATGRTVRQPQTNISNKRRLRHGQRGINPAAGGQRFNNSGRGAIIDHIEDEKQEMKRQALADQKERAHLSNRFGIDLLGPDVSEEELLAYAQLLSQEAYSSEAVKRGDFVDGSVISTSPSDTIGPNDSSFAPDELSSASSPCNDPIEDDLDPEIAEAIRLSLLEDNPGSSEVPSPFAIKYSSASQSSKGAFSPGKSKAAESSRQQEIDDLELAIQLSLVETHNHDHDHDRDSPQQPDEEFPSLPATSGSPGKSKGKGRMVW